MKFHELQVLLRSLSTTDRTLIKKTSIELTANDSTFLQVFSLPPGIYPLSRFLTIWTYIVCSCPNCDESALVQHSSILCAALVKQVLYRANRNIPQIPPVPKFSFPRLILPNAEKLTKPKSNSAMIWTLVGLSAILLILIAQTAIEVTPSPAPNASERLK